MYGKIDSSKFDVPIPHRNWKRALSEAFCILSCASPGEVVSITGPSRAGKSLLIRRLIQLLIDEDRYEQTGILPAVVVEAVNGGQHGTFSTKAFTLRMLGAIKHPLFSIKGLELDDIFALQKIERTTETALRFALEEALIARGVKFLFIDEAQHVRYASKDAQAAFAVMDSWKCLAQTSGLVIIFVGAYPILDILAKSPHLVGRKHQIHFPRYHAIKEDVEPFGELLENYSLLLDLDSSLKSLRDIAELMYEGSSGCIGLLKAWLKRADAVAMINGRRVDETLLRKTRLTDIDLNAIRSEILVGEQSLKRTSIEKQERSILDETRAVISTRSGKAFQRNPTRESAGNRTRGC